MHRQIEAWMTSGKLSSEAEAELKRWLSEPAFSDAWPEIAALIDSEEIQELEDAFRKQIEFGTGGIRGKMGPGPNRINLRTVGQAAQGLAQYVLKTLGPAGAERGIVIAYDTRNNSERFARETACIFAANGIRSYLFDGCRAAPELSFAVREKEAAAGVVISASHNPPSDNGFKAYGSDGGQVVPPHDREIFSEVKAVTAVQKLDFDQGLAQGLICVVDGEIDAAYLRGSVTTFTDSRAVRLVYTPLHGVGITSVVPALRDVGFNDLFLVAEQVEPDGNFPTVRNGIANPEDPHALALAIQKAEKIDADLILASDPDADRLGCALPDPDRRWQAPPEALSLNGNQIGVILCHYILDQRKRLGRLPKAGVVAKTIVTTDLITLIARDFGVHVVDDLLVGFKHIGAVINALPSEAEFIYGAEESHGYLAGSSVRDKDAVCAAVLLAECAATVKEQGRSLRAYLDEIYADYGYFREIQKSVPRVGADGSREIDRIMGALRANPPEQIGGHPVFETVDRQTGKATRLKTNATREIAGAKGDVIAFTFAEAGHSRISARPSGTEPKIKYYVSSSSADQPQISGGSLTEVKTCVDGMAAEIMDGMLDLSEQILKENVGLPKGAPQMLR